MSGITLDPVEDFLDARHLTTLIDRWLIAVDVLPKTRETYREKVAFFVRWWENKAPSVEWRLTKSLLYDFEVYLRSVPCKRFDRMLSYSTRHAIIRALRMMFKWAATTDRTIKNYGVWIPWPDGKAPVRKSATVEQLKRLMLIAAESRQPIRDQAILAFFIGTGCRRCEVGGMRAEDLQILPDGSGTAHVTGKSTPANESGEHDVAFDSTTGRYLTRYMDALVVTGGPLWIGDDGEGIGEAAVYQVVKRVVERAGLAKQVHGCHDLRRAFATILVQLHPESPAWADMIRRQLGHKHYSQTAAYTLIDVDDIRERIITPLNVIK